jgi:signal transduction histidine kinase
LSRRGGRILPFSAPVRVALVSLAFSLLISVPVLLFVYHQTDSLFEQRMRSGIADRERSLIAAYDTGGVPGVVRAIDELTGTGALRNGAVLFVDSSGRKITGNIAAWPPTLPVGSDWTELRLYPEGSRQAVLFAMRTLRLPGGEQLLLGTSIDDRERMRASLLEALVGALLLAIPLGLIGGMVLLRMTERHARAVGTVAARIAAGDFSHRVDERAGGEEFAVVAAAINAMLERIEELVEQLRLVTDSLAHDLRSPLTRIRANIEKAAAHATADPEQQALEAISTDIDRLLRLISATLEISRAEAGMGHEQFAPFDLAELLRDMCEIYQPVVEEHGLTIAVEGAPSLPYVGNRQMIGRAVANLVDNALKYGSGGGSIRLAAEARDDGAEIVVSDGGPGIAPGLRDDAVRKYRRLEEARTTEGSGLGLALVRAVARLHGGDVLLEDNAPGLRARLVLRHSPGGAALPAQP